MTEQENYLYDEGYDAGYSDGSSDLDECRVELTAAQAQVETLRAALKTAKVLARQAYDYVDWDGEVKAMKLLRALAGGSPGYRSDVDALHAALATTPSNCVQDIRNTARREATALIAARLEDMDPGLSDLILERAETWFRELDNQKSTP